MLHIICITKKKIGPFASGGIIRLIHPWTINSMSLSVNAYSYNSDMQNGYVNGLLKGDNAEA